MGKMEKLNSKALIALFDQLYSMSPEELVNEVFHEDSDYEKVRTIHDLKMMGVADFLDGLNDKSRPALDNYITRIYNEANFPFMVTVLAYHSQESVAKHLDVLGVKNNHQYINRKDVEDGIIALIANNLNFMVIWQPDGKRGILWLNDKNF